MATVYKAVEKVNKNKINSIEMLEKEIEDENLDASEISSELITAYKGIYNRVIKRIIDFILSLCGLIILSPVFIILCIWIKLDSKGPILFKQKRVGI